MPPYVGKDQRKWSLDKNLSVGDLIQILTIMLGGVWALTTVHTDIAVLSAAVTQMGSTVSDIKGSLDHNVERLDNRIDGIIGDKRK